MTRKRKQRYRKYRIKNRRRRKRNQRGGTLGLNFVKSLVNPLDALGY